MKPQLNSMPPLVCISNYFETRYFFTWQEALKALYQSDRIGAELDRFIQYNISKNQIDYETSTQLDAAIGLHL